MASIIDEAAGFLYNRERNEKLPGQMQRRERRIRMSYADTVFINMCKDILDNGVSTEGEKVRPKWEDGSYAYTIKRFGVVNRYDLSVKRISGPYLEADSL